MRMCIAGAAAAALVASSASAQMTLFDTGAHAPVLFSGSSTNLGWTSGDTGAQPQRWTAQPFSLPAGSWKITEIEAEYFVPGADPTEIGWKIWKRSGDAAPTDADEIASGSAAYGGVPSAPFGVDVDLGGGDYYLTVYGVSNTIAWFTNAPDGINFIDGAGLPWMWRSEAYPAPGFAKYQLDSATLSALPGEDPNDLYNAAFRLRGVPAPGALAIFGFAGLAAARRRR